MVRTNRRGWNYITLRKDNGVLTGCIHKNQGSCTRQRFNLYRIIGNRITFSIGYRKGVKIVGNVFCSNDLIISTKRLSIIILNLKGNIAIMFTIRQNGTIKV